MHYMLDDVYVHTLILASTCTHTNTQYIIFSAKLTDAS